ncbi:MAG: tetratricopeptide repeat protein [Deltaproteobacteria bacterium]|nr:tetratricopeptide repeat protein [Deltaproteobacteria bacterium]
MSHDEYPLALPEYEKAATAYTEYLARRPDDPNALEVRWYLADALYCSQQFRRAADEYAQIRDSKTTTQYREEAAAGVFFALSKLIEAEAQRKPPVALPRLEADAILPATVAVPPLQQELIRACDRFVEAAPADERVPAVKTAAAEVLVRHGHFNEALPRLLNVVENAPQSDAAVVCAHHVMLILVGQRDCDDAAKFARNVEVLGVGHGENERHGAVFQPAKWRTDKGEELISIGEKVEAHAWLRGAAREYIRVVDRSPEHPFADKALFQAAFLYSKAGNVALAASVYARMVERYPKSELREPAQWRAAESLRAAFEFERAIDAYAAFIRQYPKSENRAAAMINMAEILEATLQHLPAAQAYERYSTSYPERPDAASVGFRAVAPLEKLGEKRRLADTLKRFIARFRGDPVHAEYVRLAVERLSALKSGQRAPAPARNNRSPFLDDMHAGLAAPHVVTPEKPVQPSAPPCDGALRKFNEAMAGGLARRQGILEPEVQVTSCLANLAVAVKAEHADGPAKGRREYRRALAEDPGCGRALVNLVLLDVRTHALADAVEAVEQAGMTDAYAHAAAGHLALALRDGATAEKRARAGLSLDETNVEAMRVLARAYVAGGKVRLAAWVLRRATDLEPDDGLVQQDLADIFLQSVPPRVEEARAALRRAVTSRPDLVQSWNNLCVLEHERGDDEAATNACSAAVLLRSDLAVVWLNHGRALRGRKEDAAAREALDRALSLDPTIGDDASGLR